MKAAILLLLLVLALALWIASGLHQQQSVGKEERTVQAQLTAVAHPTKTP